MEFDKKIYLNKIFEVYTLYGLRSTSLDYISQKILLPKRLLLAIGKNKKEIIEAVLLEKFNSNCVTYINHIKNNQINHPIDNFVYMQLSIKSIFCEFSSQFDFELNKYYKNIIQDFSDKTLQFCIAQIMANIDYGKKEAYYIYNIKTDIVAHEIFEEIQQLYTSYSNNHNLEFNRLQINLLEQTIEKISNIRGKEYYLTHWKNNDEKFEELMSKN